LEIDFPVDAAPWRREQYAARTSERVVVRALVHGELLVQGEGFKGEVNQWPPIAWQKRGGHEAVIVDERRQKHQPFHDVRMVASDTAP
jgi:hypothetical protein